MGPWCAFCSRFESGTCNPHLRRAMVNSPFTTMKAIIITTKKGSFRLSNSLGTDAKKTLTVADRSGSFPECWKRIFNVVLVKAGENLQRKSVDYQGEKTKFPFVNLKR
jgi:hypothetical protein